MWRIGVLMSVAEGNSEGQSWVAGFVQRLDALRAPMGRRSPRCWPRFPESGIEPVPSSKVARFKPSPFVGQDAAAHCRSLSSGFSFVSDTRGLGGRAGRNRFDCALTNLGRGASDAHGHLHPPVLDASASRLITGRFVLLPKNLVTGVAKTRIVSRPTRRGAGLPLEGDYLEAPAESGLLSGRRKSMYTLNASILPSGPPEYHVAYRDPAQRPCTQHRDVSKEGATGCPAGGDLAYGLSSALRRLRTRHTPGHAAAWARRV
jgi:hypothetical protein